MTSKSMSYAAIATAVIAAWAAPNFLGDYATQILFRILIALILAEAWNLLAGDTGLVSLGTSSAVGLGGYVVIPLLNVEPVTWLVGLLVAAASGAALALLASPGLLRLRGLYFTVGTLALAELLRLLMVNIQAFGGATGFFLNPDPPETMALIHAAVGLLAITWLIVVGMTQGSHSVILRAIRDDETVAAQFGVRPFRVKLAVLMIACALMSAAGGLQALKLGAIEPYGMFSIRWSVDTLSMAIIGGMGHRAGPLLGTIFVVATGELLADHPEGHLALTGLLLIVVMRFAPGGLAGLLKRFLVALPGCVP
jgi:branched-chain amino acid transport system permease protein